jgi:hypothetical protein
MAKQAVEIDHARVEPCEPFAEGLDRGRGRGREGRSVERVEAEHAERELWVVAVVDDEASDLRATRDGKRGDFGARGAVSSIKGET